MIQRRLLGEITNHKTKILTMITCSGVKNDEGYSSIRTKSGMSERDQIGSV